MWCVRAPPLTPAGVPAPRTPAAAALPPRSSPHAADLPAPSDRPITPVWQRLGTASAFHGCVSGRLPPAAVTVSQRLRCSPSRKAQEAPRDNRRPACLPAGRTRSGSAPLRTGQVCEAPPRSGEDAERQQRMGVAVAPTCFPHARLSLPPPPPHGTQLAVDKGKRFLRRPAACKFSRNVQRRGGRDVERGRADRGREKVRLYQPGAATPAPLARRFRPGQQAPTRPCGGAGPLGRQQTALSVKASARRPPPLSPLPPPATRRLPGRAADGRRQQPLPAPLRDRPTLPRRAAPPCPPCVSFSTLSLRANSSKRSSVARISWSCVCRGPRRAVRKTRLNISRPGIAARVDPGACPSAEPLPAPRSDPAGCEQPVPTADRRPPTAHPRTLAGVRDAPQRPAMTHFCRAGPVPSAYGDRNPRHFKVEHLAPPPQNNFHVAPPSPPPHCTSSRALGAACERWPSHFLRRRGAARWAISPLLRRARRGAWRSFVWTPGNHSFA
ncbi:WAS/WASL-interacting protein family member 2-like [Schistocerca cancellata]|uniref:WAS/WASL-interacting protein family member 2-like n=1 Tax=Schistocerca cancellata TaxID=274614 RepID=UPI002117AE3A|nr:WAS/WASL-interacting protein family member 2-like [Schistocerca cancellata]